MTCSLAAPAGDVYQFSGALTPSSPDPNNHILSFANTLAGAPLNASEFNSSGYLTNVQYPVILPSKNQVFILRVMTNFMTFPCQFTILSSRINVGAVAQIPVFPGNTGRAEVFGTGSITAGDLLSLLVQYNPLESPDSASLTFTAMLVLNP